MKLVHWLTTAAAVLVFGTALALAFTLQDALRRVQALTERVEALTQQQDTTGRQLNTLARQTDALNQQQQALASQQADLVKSIDAVSKRTQALDDNISNVRLGVTRICNGIRAHPNAPGKPPTADALDDCAAKVDNAIVLRGDTVEICDVNTAPEQCYLAHISER